MIYPFMTLKNRTEVTHTEKLSDGTVKVYFEQPHKEDGFHSAMCVLPYFEWCDIDGFTDNEMKYYDEYVHSVADIILDFSTKGGFAGASNGD